MTAVFGGAAAVIVGWAVDGQIVEGEYANHHAAEAIGMALHWTIEGDFISIALEACKSLPNSLH